MRLRIALAAVSLLLLIAHPATISHATARENGIAVLYPEIGAPYRDIFEQIVAGIVKRGGGRVSAIPIPQEVEPAEVASIVRQQNFRIAIVLGRRGLQAGTSLENKVEIIAGAVLSVSESEARENTILSLAPEPGLLFARLKELQPEIRRVTAIYHPQTNEWLMRLARSAARTQGIELNALPAEDLKTALRLYQDFFAGSSRADALWLPQDNVTVEDGTILPLVLKETWKRGVPLFSSSLAHVRRGALFALYPDNPALGAALADIALAYLGGERPRKGIQPLRGVQTAVNTRTASHLGINLKPQAYDLLLPER